MFGRLLVGLHWHISPSPASAAGSVCSAAARAVMSTSFFSSNAFSVNPVVNVGQKEEYMQLSPWLLMSETCELLTDKVGSFTVAFRSFSLTERSVRWGTSWWWWPFLDSSLCCRFLVQFFHSDVVRVTFHRFISLTVSGKYKKIKYLGKTGLLKDGHFFSILIWDASVKDLIAQLSQSSVSCPVLSCAMWLSQLDRHEGRGVLITFAEGDWTPLCTCSTNAGYWDTRFSAFQL